MNNAGHGGAVASAVAGGPPASARAGGPMFDVAGTDAEAYAVDDGAPAAVSLTYRHTLASAITSQLRM